MTILKVTNLSKHFSGLTALDKVNLSIQKGSIHGLIGPNGAGKSTLFKNIAGFLKPSSGEIIFDNLNITGKKPHQIAKTGIIRTFQEPTLFNELSVFDNLLIGFYMTYKTNIFIDSLISSNKSKTISKIASLLDFMNLSQRQSQLAAELPLGSQRALAIAIALASQPKLLLLDEPFAGMNAEETQSTMKLIKKIQKTGTTIVLVEHDMKAVMGLCDYLSVLNFGTLIAEGKPTEIKSNKAVISAYLGKSKK